MLLCVIRGHSYFRTAHSDEAEIHCVQCVKLIIFTMRIAEDYRRAMSQQLLADAVGVSRQTINAIEKGSDVFQSLLIKFFLLECAPNRCIL